MPQARRLLAVPFVGKDTPSDAAQFAHPDVVIGLTILAYRYEGLRASDFGALLSNLKAEMASQLGPYRKRPAAIQWRAWVGAAGARVRGDGAADTSTAAPAPPATGAPMTGDSVPERQPLSRRPSASSTISRDLEGDVGSVEEVPPLHLIELQDAEQVEPLYELLRCQPALLRSYLEDVVFPKTMTFAASKLAASGQELGSDILFETRYGFSGTLS